MDLGPKRDMVSYYLAGIRLRDSFPYGEGLERKEDLYPVHHRLLLRTIHLLRGQLPGRASQLCQMTGIVWYVATYPTRVDLACRRAKLHPLILHTSSPPVPPGYQIRSLTDRFGVVSLNETGHFYGPELRAQLPRLM